MLGAFSILLGATASAADGSMLPAVLASDTKIKLDGIPKEIPGSWNSLDKVISGKAPKQLAAFAQGAIAYDDTHLFVAMRLDDGKIVRTAVAGPNEDHATLSLAFPLKARSYRTYQVDLYPGLPGKLPGVVKIGDAKVNGAELVEAPDGEGLTFEAKIPWGAFAESSRVRVGMRASLRYVDYTAPGRLGVVVATSPAREGGAMPQLLTESEYPLIAGMLREKGISEEPAREAFGNVSGDGTWERVALFEKYLVILGSRFRGGKEFVSSELSISRAKAVQRMELADFDGDGAQEILLLYRVGSQDEYREVLQVLKVKPDESLSSPFVHEVGMKSTAGELHNEVRIVREGGKLAVSIGQGEVKGYEKDSYSEPKPSEMPACLLPWDPIKERKYGWETSEFKKLAETAQKGGASKRLTHGGGGVSPRRASASNAGKGSRPASPQAPRPPSGDEMLDQIYALYRKDRSVKSKQPGFDFVTDVAASAANERVLVHDRDIVCFGKAFRDGQSYVYTTIGVGSSEDIIDMTASDLTGDGKAEILVRAIVRAKSGSEPDKHADKGNGKKPGSKKASNRKRDHGKDRPSDEQTVERLVFMVFQVKEDGIKRIFAAETGRAIEGNLMLGGLRFIEGSRGLDIETMPGKAHGFTKATYPFPEDPSQAGGFEPLALPWGSLGTRRYQFDGSRYALK